MPSTKKEETGKGGATSTSTAEEEADQEEEAEVSKPGAEEYQEGTKLAEALEKLALETQATEKAATTEEAAASDGGTVLPGKAVPATHSKRPAIGSTRSSTNK